MKLFDFTKHFPTEESCEEKIKEMRIKKGIVCLKCECTHHYWKTLKQILQCSKYGYKQSLRVNSSITTEGASSSINFKNLFGAHKSQVIAMKVIGKVLTRVNIVIANAKTLFVDTYYGVKPEFLQEYLNAYCYKFNRRYLGGRFV